MYREHIFPKLPEADFINMVARLFLSQVVYLRLRRELCLNRINQILRMK